MSSEQSAMHASPQFWESAPVGEPNRVYFTSEGDGRVIAGGSGTGATLTHVQVGSLIDWLLRVGGYGSSRDHHTAAELERAAELAERYGGAIIAISTALTADDLNPAGRIMRARGFIAGLAEAEMSNA